MVCDFWVGRSDVSEVVKLKVVCSFFSPGLHIENAATWGPH